MTFIAKPTQAILAWANFIYSLLSYPCCKIYSSRIWLLVLLSSILASCRDKEIVRSEQNIISFELKNIVTKTSIDQSNRLITVIVPYGTILKNVAPAIELSDGATVIPSSGTPQDFTKAVYYTLTGRDGIRKVYQVLCTSAFQPQPEINAISSDTIRAGDTLSITGRHFGNFALGVSTFLREKNTETETPIPFRLVDSLRVQLFVPASLPASDYHVVIVKDKLRTISKITTTIRIPRPEITALRRTHILQSDTLWIAGNYIQPGKYSYSIRLNNKNSRLLSPSVLSDGKIGAIPGTSVEPGIYEIQILNNSERSISTPFKQVRIYDNVLPFVLGIIEAKVSYKADETVRLRTSNFSVLNARFYSVRFIGTNTQHTQNAIFNGQSGTLNLTIPSEIAKGTYQISIDLLDNTGKPLYEIGMDDLILIQ